jgi:hypothetical protein
VINEKSVALFRSFDAGQETAAEVDEHRIVDGGAQSDR